MDGPDRDGPPAPEGPSGKTPLRPTARKGDGRPVRLLDAVANLPLGRLLAVWLGIVLGCGVAYWLLGLWWRPSLVMSAAPVEANLEGLLTSLYFSCITATSVGYGDVAPVGPARLLAAVESVMGLLLVGCVISKLVSRRQEQLVEEIHLIAFEDRLGRVRSNLHRVLSDLQSLSGECVRQTLSPEQTLGRVESTAMVFEGELRTVHDLLYRPQRSPEESVLEVLLVHLAASLKALSDVLDGCPIARGASGILKKSVGSITVLAGQICGECVPRQYAPELKGRMDHINELARRLGAWQG